MLRKNNFYCLVQYCSTYIRVTSKILPETWSPNFLKSAKLHFLTFSPHLYYSVHCTYTYKEYSIFFLKYLTYCSKKIMSAQYFLDFRCMCSTCVQNRKWFFKRVWRREERTVGFLTERHMVGLGRWWMKIIVEGNVF